MLGSFAAQIPADAPHGSRSAGDYPVVKNAADNAAAGVRNHKGKTAPFQFFMSPDEKDHSPGGPEKAGDSPEDDPAHKAESSEHEADTPSEPGGYHAEDEADLEAHPFEADQALGTDEAQKHEDQVRMRLPSEVASGAGGLRDLGRGSMMQNASGGGGALSGLSFAAWSFSQAADSAAADTDVEMEAPGLLLQGGAALAQGSSAAPLYLAGTLPLNPVADNGVSPGPGMIADAALAMAESGSDMILRPDGGPPGVTETRSPAFTTLHGMQTAQHVANQLLYAMIRSSERSIDLMLNPAELGRVRLTLLHGEMGMVVNIAAERAETLELMRRHSAILGQEFQDMGYGDTDFTFTRERQADEHGHAQGNAPAGAMQQPESLPADVDPVWLSPADRLDIRL